MVDTAAESTMRRAENADMNPTRDPLPEDLITLHVPNLLRRIDATREQLLRRRVVADGAQTTTNGQAPACLQG